MFARVMNLVDKWSSSTRSFKMSFLSLLALLTLFTLSNATSLAIFNSPMSLSGVKFHPKGTVSNQPFLFIGNTPNNGPTQIFETTYDFQKKKATKPRQLTHFRSRATWAQYLSDGSIIFLHDKDGNENFQVGLVSAKDTQPKIRFLTDHPHAKHLLNQVTEKYIYFTCNQRDKEVFDIMRVSRASAVNDDASTPLPEHEHLYTPSSGIAYAAYVSEDETWILLEKHSSNMNRRLIYFNTITKQEVDVSQNVEDIYRAEHGDMRNPQRTNRWGLITFLDETGNHLLVMTDFAHEFLRLAVLSWPKSGDFTLPPRFQPLDLGSQYSSFDIAGIIPGSKPDSFFANINTGGFSTLLRFRIQNSSGSFIITNIEQIPLPIHGVISSGDETSSGVGITINKDETHMLVTMSNSATPSALYAVDLTTLESSRVYKPRLKVDPAAFYLAPATVHTMQSFDSLPISYMLQMPDPARTAKPAHGYPAIVVLHGGPEDQSTDGWSPLRQYLINLGFAIITPNIRGSTGYGRRFADLDNRELRFNAVRDIYEVAKYASTHHSCIDGTKMVVLGGSYGGWASLASMVMFPDFWKGAVDIVGISNLLTFFEKTAPWRRQVRYEEYGNYETQKELLRRLSPIFYVNRVKNPIFIIGGANDERVPAAEAQSMYDRLMEESKKQGKERVAKSQLMIFPDEGHGIEKPANKLKAWKAVGEFLKEIAQSDDV